MKDSGIEWIGEIPEGWEVVPVRFCFSEVRTKNLDGKEQNALQFKFGNIISKINFNANDDNYVADTITNYTVVLPDTIMINGLNLNYDFKSLRVALVKEKGVITSAYLAIFPDKEKLSPQYATYLFKGYETKMAFHNMGAGIRKTLGYKEFKNQPLLLPSKKEQNRISAYLDSECFRIDATVFKTRSSIEEYKRLKLSLIAQFIHPTCDLSIPMITFGKIISNIEQGWSPSPSNSEFSWNVLTLAAVKHGTFYSSESKPFEYAESKCTSLKLSNGDFLLTRSNTRELVGQVCMVKNSPPNYIFSDLIYRITYNEKYILPKYALFCLQSPYLRQQIQRDAHGSNSTMVKITHKDIFNWSLPLPSLDKQKKIADYLDAKCAEIDKLIAKKEQLVKELESYKKSLIYEVVTGKREV